MSAEMSTRYHACGAELKRLRAAQGFATQGDLAKLLGFTQQTVSRWEAGDSRPRADQIPLLAKALRADPQRLLVVAGHAPEQSTVSFDQPLPLASLSPEGFQRFCRSLLEALFADARVHAAGKTGHKQFGIDIEVEFENGDTYTYQCKREASFGPEKVKKAVEAHKVHATEKFLLLSRVASQHARGEIKKHRSWELWDQDDLSEKLRTLPKEMQRRIVDTYFPGQRLALIGEPSPGPWQSPADFFAPLLSDVRPFSHQWELVGRERERQVLAFALADRTNIVVSLTGPAGGGKSRLLHAAIGDFATAYPGTSIFMLSPTEQVTAKSLEDLGQGDKLLVVDDAHDRSDRELLSRYVADTRMNARLLLVYRPYAQDVIERELAHFGLAGVHVSRVELAKPTKADGVALASQVLSTLGAPTGAAPHIADVAYDSPLSVVVGAWIVAKEGLHPELFGSHDVFKTTVLQHYKAVIARGISSSARDQESIGRILRVIALVQPVIPDDPKVLALVSDVESVSRADATRLVKLLIASGVLFKRGAQYRLSPDLLADSIIETAYISTNGASNGVVERVFAAAIAEHKAHILLNLGRLDWRRNEGDTTDSRLVDALWGGLDWEDGYQRPQLKAAVEAAYYQPRQALELAERLVSGGHGENEDVCRLIRNSAYSLRHLARACELLWEVGKLDPRATNQFPSHALRLLTELAAPEPRKPIAYCEGVVDFALSLIPFKASWSAGATPFDILKGALATEGHVTSRATSRSLALTAFGVSPTAVAGMRERIIDAILDGLTSTNKRHAFEAAKLLHTALSGPIGLLNCTASDEQLLEWSTEFADTLERVKRLVEANHLPPAVLVRIGESVARHAQCADGATKELARSILMHLDRDLETRVTRVLMDGWGQATWEIDDGQPRHNEQMQGQLAAELERTYPSAERLAAFIGERLLILKSYGDETLQSAHLLVNRLINNQIGLARECLNVCDRSPESPLAGYAAVALVTLRRQAPAEAHTRIETLLAAGDEDFLLVARAYAMELGKSPLLDQDREVLRRIFSSDQPDVLGCAPWIFREVAQLSTELAVELLASANPALLEVSRGQVFMWLRDDKLVPLSSISDEQLQRILVLFESPARLDEHSVHGFLTCVSKRNPRLVVELAKRRLEKAAKSDDWSMSPIGGISQHTPSLDVLGHEDGAMLFRGVLEWALPHAGRYPFAHHLADLVAGVFGFRRSVFTSVVEEWSAGGRVEHLKLIAGVLREVPPSFVFAEVEFVRRMLKSARGLGRDVYRDLSSSFCAGALTGLRSGTPGEPFPEDLRMKEQAEAVLANLSKADPAYGLYVALKEHAEFGIERSKAQRMTLDEEDA